MPTKKKATKKAQATLESVAEKSVNDILSDLGDLQAATRTSLSALADAMIEKKEEMIALNRSIQEKQEELNELLGKESAALELTQLEEDLEDKKRQNKRFEVILKQEQDDKKADFLRELNQQQDKYQREIDDKGRALEEKFKTEELEKNRSYKLRELELEDQEIKASKLVHQAEEQFKNFDKKVEQKVQAIKRELEFKTQTERTKNEADVKILTSRITDLERETTMLRKQLADSEAKVVIAQERSNAIAIASLEKESSKEALDKIEKIAQKQAESTKR